MNRQKDHDTLFSQPQSSRATFHPRGTECCRCQSHVIVTQNSPSTSQKAGRHSRPLIYSSTNEHEMRQHSNTLTEKIVLHGWGSNSESNHRVDDLVLQKSLPRWQTRDEKSKEIKCTSQVEPPVVHYIKAKSSVSLNLRPSIVRLVPQRNFSKTETVLQIDQDNFQNNFTSKNQDHTAVRCSNGTKSMSAKDTAVAHSKKESETCSLFRPCRVELMSPEDNSLPENVTSNSMTNKATEDISADKPRKDEIEKLEYSRRQWTFILISWMITALGLGAYIYMIAVAYSGYPQILKEKPVFPLIVVISNVCLVSAIYCNRKLKKYFLL